MRRTSGSDWHDRGPNEATGAFAAALAFAGLATPAYAIAPNCQGQIDALKGNLAEQPKAAAEPSVRAKLNEAQRLCSENKDEEAQALARQVRQQMDKSGSDASGSTLPPPKQQQ
jgi:hypothetical protein